MPRPEKESAAAPRHFLIAVGGMGYDPKVERLSPLPAAPWELDTIEDLLRPFGYEAVLPQIRLDAKAPAILDALGEFFASGERTSDDVVIFYFTGHARALASGNLYLLPRGANLNNPARTAIRCANLAEVFFEGSNPRPENVWVLLDVCSAGLGAAQLVAEVLDSYRGIEFRSKNRGFVTFAAAAGTQEAKQRTFVTALREAIADFRGHDPSDPYVDVGQLIEPISKRLGSGQDFDGNLVARRGRSRFLVNRRFDPRLASPGLVLDTVSGREIREARERMARGSSPRDLRATSEDAARWLEAHSGRRRAADVPPPPPRFTGRTRALDALSAFMTDRSPDLPILLLAGAAGAGKSATLRSLCARPEVGFGAADGREPPEAIDLFFMGTALSPHEMFLRLLEAIPPDPDLHPGETQLAQELIRAPLGARIVIDDAEEGEERARDLARLCRPFRRVRILAASSRPPAGPPDPDLRRIDLDAEPWFDPRDLLGFVEGLLLAGGERGRSFSAREAADAAEAIVAASGRNFLAAELHARLALRTGRAPAPALPSDPVAAAARGTFAAFAPDPARILRRLLPLALAEGAGLPADPEWRDLAAALSGEEVGGEEIEGARREAAALISAEIEEGETFYRLAHEPLRRHLLDACGSGDPSELHRRIAERLLSSVPRDPSTSSPRWNLATPYVRRHLAAHAAKGGVLEPLLGDLRFVVEAAPEGLARHLPPDSSLGRAYARAGGALRCLEEAGEVATALSLAAIEEKADDLARALEGLALPRAFHPRWVADCGKASFPVAAAGHSLVALPASGALELRRAESGESVGRLPWAAPPPETLSIGSLHGQPVVVIGPAEGTLVAHEARAPFAVRILERLPGRAPAVAAAAFGSRVVSLEPDGALRAWPGGTRLGDIGRAERGRAAFCTLRERPAVVKIGDRGLVRAWYLEASSISFSHGFEATEPILRCAPSAADHRLAVIAGAARDAFLLDLERARLDLIARVGVPFDAVATDGAFALLRRGAACFGGRLDLPRETKGGGARPPPGSV